MMCLARGSPPRPELVPLIAGTVMVLTTPDANRTMLSYLGTQHEVGIDSALEAAISSARVLLIEGYLWEVRRLPLCHPRTV